MGGNVLSSPHEHIPVYSSLSPPITQPEAEPAEGKMASGFEMLRDRRGRSDCREETSREWHKASLKPGLAGRGKSKVCGGEEIRAWAAGAPNQRV